MAMYIVLSISDLIQIGILIVAIIALIRKRR